MDKTEPSQRKKYLWPNRDQLLLVPPSVHDYVGDGHFAKWLVRIIESLDLSAFCSLHEQRLDPLGRGRPPYHPSILLGVLLYGATRRVFTSRKLEEMTYSDLGTRYITGNRHPDHTTLYNFRVSNQAALESVFAQVVLLCNTAGLVDLENVALDGVVISADVSKYSSVKLTELQAKYAKAKARAQALLEKMDTAEEAEQKQLQEEAKDAKTRQERLEEALAFLRENNIPVPSSTSDTPGPSEDQAKNEQWKLEGEAVRLGREAKQISQVQMAKVLGVSRQRIGAWESGRYSILPSFREPLRILLNLSLEALPNLPEKTIPEKFPSCIILNDFESYWTYRPHMGYRIGYVALASVDAKNQVILDTRILKKNAEGAGLVPSLESIQERMGRWPGIVTADAGFYSHDNAKFAEKQGIDFYSPPGALPAGKTPSPESQKMIDKLAIPGCKATYNTRSATVEPVFGNIESNLGFRRFTCNGYSRVSCEWLTITTVHNLLKLISSATSEKLAEVLSHFKP